jgi:TP901 family phage tail tape measure protein
MALNQLGLGFVFTAQDLASGVINRINDSFQRLDQGSAASAAAMRSNFTQFGQGLAIAGAGIAGLMVLDRAVAASAEFSQAIAEVSTLVDEATFSTADLTRVSLELAAVYGGSAKGQARGLYQTISAGITDAARATELLRVANELAIGGVTDTKTAVDALTNVVNAYAASGAKARDVSDAFFVAIRGGKTTAVELAGSIGRVAPTAAALGVSFSDLLASLASISGQGIATAEAASGLKAAFANIIRPTSDAVKEAARLGIKFDAATLRAKGLTGFLNAITSAANFNADSVSKLFGSIEALNSIMALTANHSATYTGILGQMAARSGATKAAFDRMASTLVFQQQRFKALKENVLIVIGQALEPLARAIVRVVNSMLEAFLRIPSPVRGFLVKAVAIASALLVLLGGFVAAKAGAAILLLGLKALGITLGGIVASLLPVIAAFGAIALVTAGFAAALRHNVGGIGAFFESAVARIRLLIHALAQLFDAGEFSGAVMAELDRAENAGVKQFAIRVFQIAGRIQQFFAGIADGFTAAMQVAGPVFTSLAAALRQLGEAFGVVGDAGADALVAVDFRGYASAGVTIGRVFGQVVSVLVDALAAIVRVAAGIVSGVRSALSYFRPVLEFLGTTVRALADAFGGLLSDIVGVSDKARDGTSVWSGLGQVIGVVAGNLVVILAGALSVITTALTGVIAVVRAVIQAFTWLGRYLGETAAKIYLLFTETIPHAVKTVVGAIRTFFQPLLDFITGIVDGIHSALDRVISFVGRLVAKIPARFRPAFLDSIVDAGEAAEQSIAERAARAAAPALRASAVAGPGSAPPGLGVPATGPLPAFLGPLSSAAPAVAELRGRQQISDAEIDAIIARGVAASDARPVQANISLQVDGETLARASARATRNAAARAFLPVQGGG